MRYSRSVKENFARFHPQPVCGVSVGPCPSPHQIPSLSTSVVPSSSAAAAFPKRPWTSTSSTRALPTAGLTRIRGAYSESKPNLWRRSTRSPHWDPPSRSSVAPGLTDRTRSTSARWKPAGSWPMLDLRSSPAADPESWRPSIAVPARRMESRLGSASSYRSSNSRIRGWTLGSTSGTSSSVRRASSNTRKPSSSTRADSARWTKCLKPSP